MPWQEVAVFDARWRFIQDVQRRVFSLTDLCRGHGISRPVAYKWLRRFEAQGRGGLVDHSRRPRHSPNATPADLVRALCALRERRPHWGAKKLLAKLQQHHP